MRPDLLLRRTNLTHSSNSVFSYHGILPQHLVLIYPSSLTHNDLTLSSISTVAMS